MPTKPAETDPFLEFCKGVIEEHDIVLAMPLGSMDFKPERAIKGRAVMERILGTGENGGVQMAVIPYSDDAELEMLRSLV